MRGFVDLQVATSKLAELLRERFKDVRLCLTDEFTFADHDWIIDRWELRGTSLRSRPRTVAIRVPLPHEVTSNPIRYISGRELEIVQDIQVTLVQVDALATAGAGGVTDASKLLRPTLSATLEANVDATGGGVQLCIRYDHARLPVDVPGFDSSRFTVPEVCTSLDVGAISQIVGGSAPVVNAGLAVADDVVTIRLEIDDFNPATTYLPYPDYDAVARAVAYFADRATEVESAWTSFYASPPRARASGGDWSLFVSEELLTRGLERQVAEGVQSSSRFVFRRDSDAPRATWSPIGTRPHVGVTFSGDVLDACDCFGNSNVGVDVRAEFSFDVPSRDTLRATAHIDWAPDLWHVTCCIVEAAVLWPFVGAAMWGGGRVGAEAYFGGLAGGPALIAVFGIAAASAAGPGTLSIPDCRPREVGSQHDYVCEMPFRPPAGSLLTGMTLAAATAVADGLVLSGALGTIPDRRPANLRVLEAPSRLEWQDVSRCSEADDRIVATGTVNVRNDGEVPLYVCAARLRDDPANVLAGAVRAPNNVGARSWAPITIALTKEALSAYTGVYGSEPDPLRLRLQTTGGAREIVIDGAGELTDETERTLIAARRIRCSQIFGRLAVPGSRTTLERVLPDPPPDALFRPQLWDVLLEHALPNERIALVDAKGNALAEVLADAHRPTTLSAFVADTGLLPLSVTRDTKGKDVHAAAKRAPKVVVRQTEVDLQATIPVGAGFLGHELGFVNARETLIVSTTDSLTVVDVSAGDQPRVIEQIAGDSLRGTPWSGALAIWGQRGLYLMRDGTIIASPVHESVTAVRADTERLHVDTAQGTSVIDARLRATSRSGRADDRRSVQVASKPNKAEEHGNESWRSRAAFAGELLALVAHDRKSIDVYRWVRSETM